VLITIHQRRNETAQQKFLSISVLPEDDPVGSKHVAPHLIFFKRSFNGFNDTLAF
jgi:hypothetical protein